MRARRCLLAMAWIGALLVGGCGSHAAAPAAPPPTETAAPEPEADESDDVAASRPGRAAVSRATYDEAMATPETVDMRDNHAQLTDAQLTGPMRGALTGCRAPANAKITVKTAVQNGQAIGVTVDVHLVKPRSSRQPNKPPSRAETKAASKIATCVDRNVRGLTWPASPRRDSFTTEF